MRDVMLGVAGDRDHGGRRRRMGSARPWWDGWRGSPGRGFGLAFAADQNGYPGPMHVLELRDRLKLSPDQEARTHELMHAMFAEFWPPPSRTRSR